MKPLVTSVEEPGQGRTVINFTDHIALEIELKEVLDAKQTARLQFEGHIRIEGKRRMGYLTLIPRLKRVEWLEENKARLSFDSGKVVEMRLPSVKDVSTVRIINDGMDLNLGEQRVVSSDKLVRRRGRVLKQGRPGFYGSPLPEVWTYQHQAFASDGMPMQAVDLIVKHMDRHRQPRGGTA